MFALADIKQYKDKIIKGTLKGMSYATICKEKGFPQSTTFFKWLNSDAQFKTNYVQAREQQALFYAESIEAVINDLKNAENPTRELTDIARLEIDTKKWIASRLLPKVYGSNTSQTNIQVNVAPVTGMQILDSIETTETDTKTD